MAPAAGSRSGDVSVDALLRILENPTRRKILERLAKESHYPLQLSRELRVSQQAVVKHLRVLEEGHLVESRVERSDLGGPKRRAYSAKRSLSLAIDVGPSLFTAEVRPLEDASGGRREYAQFDETLRRIDEAGDARHRIRKAAELVERLNKELDDLENKRARLVGIKDRALRLAHRDVERLFMSYDERSVMYALVDEGLRAASDLAARLEMRESLVHDVLRRLTAERILA